MITAQRPFEAHDKGSAVHDLVYIWGLTAVFASQQDNGEDSAEIDQRRWNIRYDVEQLDDGQALRVASLLGLQKLRHGEQEEEQSGLVAFDGTMLVDDDIPSAHGRSVTVSMTVDPDKSRFNGAILVVKPEAGMTQEGLADAAQRVENALHETGRAFMYSFRVAGSVPMNTMRVSDENELLKAQFVALTEQAKAKLIESYIDDTGRTISETWRSPYLAATVLTKDKKANLQLSRHQNDAAQTIDWIVGVPIITGDYAQSE